MRYLRGELRTRANLVPLHALPSASWVGQLELYSFQAVSYVSLHRLWKETDFSRGLIFHPTLSEMNYPLEVPLSLCWLYKEPVMTRPARLKYYVSDIHTQPEKPHPECLTCGHLWLGQTNSISYLSVPHFLICKTGWQHFPLSCWGCEDNDSKKLWGAQWLQY